jgi:hypothetical protein
VLAETGVIPVLLAAARIAGGDLQVAVLVGADPHVRPGRRNHECTEPIDHFARANNQAVGISVNEHATEALAALEVRRDTLEGEIDADVAARTAEREPLSAAIPEDLRALYEKLRASSGGIGAAALRARRCGGCRIELYGTALQDARAADEDEVLRCEECRRILVRTAESGL